MLDFLIGSITGTLLGVLSGMGVGGGSLLLLWLTQVEMLEQSQARIINLLFFLPAAAISTLFQRKYNIDKKPAMVAAIAGCVSAIIFSFIGKIIDLNLSFLASVTSHPVSSMISRLRVSM